MLCACGRQTFRAKERHNTSVFQFLLDVNIHRRVNSSKHFRLSRTSPNTTSSASADVQPSTETSEGCKTWKEIGCTYRARAPAGFEKVSVQRKTSTFIGARLFAVELNVLSKDTSVAANNVPSSHTASFWNRIVQSIFLQDVNALGSFMQTKL